MATLYTYGQLAAKLVVEGALDKMAGKAVEKFPIEGIKLKDEQRAKLGRPPGGATFYYEIMEKNGVFMDFEGATTTVWFREADARDALSTFEIMLNRAYPGAKQKSDKANDKNDTTRERSYDVPLGGDRVAVVDIIYAAPGALPRSFAARIHAYAEKKQ